MKIPCNGRAWCRYVLVRIVKRCRFQHNRAGLVLRPSESELH
ncbi:hypothetical protein [Neisseria sp. Dent CA1/247]|nr:hypothetical protein [Neisseria sp. Dent CA1/247]